MAIQFLHAATASKLPVSACFMTRQPVLDRRQEAVAFDLSFYSADSQDNQAGSGAVIQQILAHFNELDLVKTVGELRGFIDVDSATIMSDVFTHIPRTKFIFNLDAAVPITDELLARLSQLQGQGFLFSVNEAMGDGDSLAKLLPMMEVVRFDMRRFTREELVQRTSQPQLADKRLLADHVDTLAQFEACLALGFDYVHGYYFAHPVIHPDHKLAPSQAAIIDIIALISGEADSTEIEAHIKRDVSLSLNLLRLVNTAAVGMHRIDSLRQALMVLGRKQLANWLQVLLYAEAHENAPGVKPLLMLATNRGKLLELIALRHRPGNRGIADAAFTVGIMSLMDALFGMPMPEIVQQIPVVEEIGEALLERRGYFGELLALAEALERRESPALLLPMLDKFQLDCDSLYLLQTEAFEWSNNVSQAMHP
ncbi:EAL and modified HD-GYP domain-containing signal transduction protein [Paucimonas lemoignei]|uniref:EAL and modified HD-GYP domain-containing signal transduction protein n=1 Tax=Paucimonas lemoignei TaxID=29443 RepID=A0A4R3HZ71_PAULE|nr:HDOD domain-containing protein [Paucimonas lemoignei]TCS38697.1 EAL and modified HD-GYP domain-containing signal transduction protein [Paucimonas lemoignei]